MNFVLKECEIECCTSSDCNSATTPSLPSGPTTCYSCLQSTAEECKAKQVIEACRLNPKSLGITHCGSAAIRFTDSSGVMQKGFVRGCINCAGKRACVYPHTHSFIYRLIHPSIHSYIRLSVCPSIHSFIHPSQCPSIVPFFHPFSYSSHSFIHLFLRSFTHIVISFINRLFIIYASFNQSIHSLTSFIYLIACLFVCLFVFFFTFPQIPKRAVNM